MSLTDVADPITGFAPSTPAAPVVEETPLDNAVWHSLTGGHDHLAEVHGRARRYPLDVSPFTALEDPADPAAWADLAALVGPGGTATVTGEHTVAAGWQPLASGAGVQLVDRGADARPDPDTVVLTDDDVPQMLDLVERTRPGPFRPRTIVMGSYLGLKVDGRLVAMAGQRLNPTGWREISAVCTDPGFRGRGLGTRLVLAVAADIRERGETPIMHASAANTNAIRLYESLGFRLRRRTTFGTYAATAT